MRHAVSHTIEPVFNPFSKILILGTMPSQKSREAGFYYAHPQNRFWRVLAAVLGRAVPETVFEKQALALENGIALWDVLKSCEIKGSQDVSIKKPVANDIAAIVKQTRIAHVFTTGAAATKLYQKLCAATVGIEAYGLPSTSAANAKSDLCALIKAYNVIVDYL